MLHKDGLLNLFDFESFETLWIMFTWQDDYDAFLGKWEGNDLLGLLHTNVCGPMSLVLITLLLLPMNLLDMDTIT